MLFCHLDRAMMLPQWSDVGMWLQTSMLLLLREAGLDIWPQEYMALFGKTVKRHLGIDDAREVMFCDLAIGYRDALMTGNNFFRPPIPLDEAVSFVGF